MTLLSAAAPAFGWINWSIVVLYLIGMVAIGHFTGKRRKRSDAEGYFLGERSVPIWAVILSTIAAMLSAATFLGVPQQPINGDLRYMILNVGGFIAMLIVGIVFIPRFYKAGTITIYGYLDKRLGQGSRVACAGMFIFGRILASGVRLFFAAYAVSLLLFRSAGNVPTHGEVIASILLIGAVGVAYTVSGGIKAVIWTDCAQVIVVVGAALMSIGLLLHWIPLSVPQIVHTLGEPGTGLNGHSKLAMVDTSWDPTHHFTIWIMLFANMPLQLAAYGTDHDMAQRMLTTKSAFRGSLSAIFAQVLSAGVVMLFLIIGLLLYIFYKRPDLMGSHAPSDPLGTSMQVYPQFLLNHLPMGLAGLAMAGLFAVAQGSLDSAINAMASSAVADLYWPLRRLRGLPSNEGSTNAPRAAVAGMGAVLILFAIWCVFLYDPNGKRSLLDFALNIMSFAYSGMLAVFLTALLTRRGNTASVLAALATGVLVVTLLQEPVMTWWSTHLLRHTFTLVADWHMPIALIFAFAVCVSGAPRDRSPEVEPRGFPVVTS